METGLSREGILQRVTEIAKPILDFMGLELADVKYAVGGRKGILRVFIDRAEGVTLDDCERVSRHLGHALDVEDPIPSPYVLEVSSPGLDRPLRHREDFHRFAGRLVRVKTARPVEGQRLLIGRLSAVGESGIEMTVGKERAVRIAFEDIEAARLEVEFKSKRGRE